eukprot:c16960_g1_i1 orf=464-1534(-)
MEGHAGDGFEAFLRDLQMDFSPSPASSEITSSATYVSSHPPLPQSHSFSQTKFKGCYPPSPTGSLEISQSFGKPPNFGNSNVGNVTEKPLRQGGHRRAHSEIAFRMPDQLMVDYDVVLDNTEFSAVSDETGEDLLSAYLEMETSTTTNGAPNSATSSGLHHAQGSSVDDVFGDYDSMSKQNARGGNYIKSHSRPPRHHHSLSMDGSVSISEDLLMGDLDFLETKKAMDMDQLAELSVTDPRRAKRILANRQSAARSKERKMKYIAELEQKIHKLQTEATTLSAQLSILQRDSKGLSTQNSELKLRLQAMEQQAHLRDALNETLKEEVRWLKSATLQMGIGNGSVFTIDTHQASKPF